MHKHEVRGHGTVDDTQHLSALERIHGPLPQLMIGDIVMIRHKKSLVRKFLRKVTESYWDHTALIIFTKNPEKGYSSNIIAEAIQYQAFDAWRRGVEVHKMDRYLNDPDRYDVGVKRCMNVSNELRDHVRAFTLMNVDAPYYRLPLADLALASISRTIRKFVLKRQRFTCSGLIQKAYWNAAPWERRHMFAFRDLGDSPIELQELVSPADIAKSDACEWIWNRH
ncbi:MAG: hypothetical protein QY323_04340 [Patescibacteria group bacterium]|nr:MAG: hypothetical protein QY323_04340 [Patescibacteria group bacterium]